VLFFGMFQMLCLLVTYNLVLGIIIASMKEAAAIEEHTATLVRLCATEGHTVSAATLNEKLRLSAGSMHALVTEGLVVQEKQLYQCLRLLLTHVRPLNFSASIVFPPAKSVGLVALTKLRADAKAARRAFFRATRGQDIMMDDEGEGEDGWMADRESPGSTPTQTPRSPKDTPREPWPSPPRKDKAKSTSFKKRRPRELGETVEAAGVGDTEEQLAEFTWGDAQPPPPVPQEVSQGLRARTNLIAQESHADTPLNVPANVVQSLFTTPAKPSEELEVSTRRPARFNLETHDPH